MYWRRLLVLLQIIMMFTYSEQRRNMIRESIKKLAYASDISYENVLEVLRKIVH